MSREFVSARNRTATHDRPTSFTVGTVPSGLIGVAAADNVTVTVSQLKLVWRTTRRPALHLKCELESKPAANGLLRKSEIIKFENKTIVSDTGPFDSGVPGEDIADISSEDSAVLGRHRYLCQVFDVICVGETDSAVCNDDGGVEAGEVSLAQREVADYPARIYMSHIY